MQELAQWMTKLQHHCGTASSYAETDSADSDCDSDSNDYQCHLEAKRKFVDVQRSCVRTKPISIPSSSHPHMCETVGMSPDLSYHANKLLLSSGRYMHEDNNHELDEDDPAFYGNLAFFRSRQGQRPHVLKHSVSPFQTLASESPSGVDACDEDIFAMEL